MKNLKQPPAGMLGVRALQSWCASWFFDKCQPAEGPNLQIKLLHHPHLVRLLLRHIRMHHPPSDLPTKEATPPPPSNKEVLRSYEGTKDSVVDEVVDGLRTFPTGRCEYDNSLILLPPHPSIKQGRQGRFWATTRAL
jgi:hypothetical protein